jgi:uncharacterized protein YuzE
MPRLPIEIEREAEYNVAYVRYQEDSSRGIGKTIGHAGDQINLDLDEAGAIVGIEILSLGAVELAALAQIARAYDLDLSPLIGGTVSSAV